MRGRLSGKLEGVGSSSPRPGSHGRWLGRGADAVASRWQRLLGRVAPMVDEDLSELDRRDGVGQRPVAPEPQREPAPHRRLGTSSRGDQHRR